MRESEFDYLKWLKYCKINCPEKLPPPFDATVEYDIAPLEVALPLIGPMFEVGLECGQAYHEIIQRSSQR